MRSAYRVICLAIAAAVAVQAAAIGLAWFTVIHDVDQGVVYDESSAWNAGQLTHSTGAIVIPVLGLALLVVSFFTKVPGAVKWAGIIVGLIVLQWVLAIMAFSVPAVGALHGINALAIAAVAASTSRIVGRTAVPAEGTPATAPAPQA